MGEREREPTEDDREVPALRSQTTPACVRLVEIEEEDASRVGFEYVIPWRGGMERR